MQDLMDLWSSCWNMARFCNLAKCVSRAGLDKCRFLTCFTPWTKKSTSVSDDYLMLPTAQYLLNMELLVATVFHFDML